MKLKIIITSILFFSVSLSAQESIFLETDDGWKIHSKYVKPKKDNLPVLLLLHSQKSNYTEWKKWFNEIEKYGYGWFALEFRGHGVSTYKTDGSTQTYSSFSVSGFDNDYNKMIRDIDAAVIYLSSTGVSESRVFLVGINLGANLAIKYSAINKNIGGVVAINPAMNINDVLTVSPLRVYGRSPILFVTGQNYKKRMSEVMLLYDIAKKIGGITNTFILTEYSIKTAEDTFKSTMYKIFSWISNPVMPEVTSTNITLSTQTVSISTESINTSTTTSSYIIVNTETDEDNNNEGKDEE
jgi:dienelactone hydrolase